ncbi:MAG: hypothetical protein PVI57_03885 [Gemmatimonadota bacterium]|jgi:hypothetical protein
MPTLSDVVHARQSSRLRLLLAIYQLTNGDPVSQMSVEKLAEAVGAQDPEQIQGMLQYLEDAQLLSYQQGTTAQLTLEGVQLVEHAVQHPHKRLGAFPPLAQTLGGSPSPPTQAWRHHAAAMVGALADAFDALAERLDGSSPT